MHKIKFNRYKKLKICLILVIAFAIEIPVVYSCWGVISLKWNSYYDKENFNCNNMSRLCALYFKIIGVPVQVVHGYINKTTGHVWLLLFGSLEFESTTLTPQFFEKNSDKYSILKIEMI